MGIEVCNMRIIRPSTNYDFQIDRMTPLGNPFPVNIGRFACISEYEIALRRCLREKSVYAGPLCTLEYQKVKVALNTMYKTYMRHKKLRLFCWCAPEKCHGDIIKKILEEVIPPKQ